MYQINRIISLRNKLTDEMLEVYAGITLEGDDFINFVTDLYNKLPSSVDYDSLFKSCLYLSGQQITKENIFELAWRIAGNLHKLRNGVAVLSCAQPTADEWLPVQIIEAIPHCYKDKTKGFIFTFRVLAGTPCPRTLTKFWSIRFCRFISKELGFSLPRKQYPFSDGHEFVSMRMYILVEVAKSNEFLYFEKTKHTATCKEWNRYILKARMKIDPPCPNDFVHPCYKCPIGYKECLAGTHPETYTQGYCVYCETDSFFDPAKDDKWCVNCQGNPKT